MSKTGTALVKFDGGAYPALSAPAGLPDAIRENIGNDQVTQWDLPQVRVPAGGAMTWEVPSLDGEPEAVKELTGIIAYTKLTRSFWAESLDESGGGSPPDCSSPDGFHGYGNPGGLCAECEYARWGSAIDGGRGQGCKQQRPLFLLTPDAYLPVAVIAPPTSLQPVKQYLLRLGGQGLRYWHVITSMRLTKAQNRGGIWYGKIVPVMAGILDEEVRPQVDAYHSSLEESMKGYHEAVS